MTDSALLAMALWCAVVCLGAVLAVGISRLVAYLWDDDDDLWEADRQRERIRQALGDDQ